MQPIAHQTFVRDPPKPRSTSKNRQAKYENACKNVLCPRNSNSPRHAKLETRTNKSRVVLFYALGASRSPQVVPTNWNASTRLARWQDWAVQLPSSWFLMVLTSSTGFFERHRWVGVGHTIYWITHRCTFPMFFKCFPIFIFLGSHKQCTACGRGRSPWIGRGVRTSCWRIESTLIEVGSM